MTAFRTQPAALQANQTWISCQIAPDRSPDCYARPRIGRQEVASRVRAEQHETAKQRHQLFVRRCPATKQRRTHSLPHSAANCAILSLPASRSHRRCGQPLISTHSLPATTFVTSHFASSIHSSLPSHATIHSTAHTPPTSFCSTKRGSPRLIATATARPCNTRVASRQLPVTAHPQTPPHAPPLHCCSS